MTFLSLEEIEEQVLKQVDLKKKELSSGRQFERRLEPAKGEIDGIENILLIMDDVNIWFFYLLFGFILKKDKGKDFRVQEYV